MEGIVVCLATFARPLELCVSGQLSSTLKRGHRLYLPAGNISSSRLDPEGGKGGER